MNTLSRENVLLISVKVLPDKTRWVQCRISAFHPCMRVWYSLQINRPQRAESEQASERAREGGVAVMSHVSQPNKPHSRFAQQDFLSFLKHRECEAVKVGVKRAKQEIPGACCQGA